MSAGSAGAAFKAQAPFKSGSFPGHWETGQSSIPKCGIYAASKIQRVPPGQGILGPEESHLANCPSFRPRGSPFFHFSTLTLTWKISPGWTFLLRVGCARPLTSEVRKPGRGPAPRGSGGLDAARAASRLSQPSSV